MTGGLRWKDLGHNRPRQSCFGQRRLDGSEPAFTCKGEDKGERVSLAYPGTMDCRGVPSDTVGITESHPIFQTNLGDKRSYHTGP
jgi:hypothetical protein